MLVLFVLLLNRRFFPAPSNIPSFAYSLPKINALINSLCLTLLIFSLYFVKQKKYEIHKKLNLTAFALSAIFLVSYTTYHYFVPETSFGGVGFKRTVYYFILTSHIITSVLLVPLALFAFYFGLKGNRPLHKKIVRWAYPVWVYVSITGILVYLFLSPYYNFPV